MAFNTFSNPISTFNPFLRWRSVFIPEQVVVLGKLLTFFPELVIKQLESAVAWRIHHAVHAWLWVSTVDGACDEASALHDPRLKYVEALLDDIQLDESLDP